MRIPNQSFGSVRQGKAPGGWAASRAIAPQARVGGGGGLGDVWDCIICTAVCTIFVGDVVNCEQACRASGCLDKVASSGFFA
jgi:hypothetical protein